MEWLARFDVAVKKVVNGLAIRLRIRRTGLMQLRHEISTCEYEDVRVMWELLCKGKGGGGGGGGGNSSKSTALQGRGSRQAWSVFQWVTQARRRLCGSFWVGCNRRGRSC